MAERVASGNYDQLHHFIADDVWDATPLESELLNQADRLVGGKDAVLVIDDTAMPKLLCVSAPPTALQRRPMHRPLGTAKCRRIDFT